MLTITCINGHSRKPTPNEMDTLFLDIEEGIKYYCPECKQWLKWRLSI